eukprot:TRINITY_DN476_c0_g13_i1.p1 TRINITY_DN476_c0_g13~~TRINITY_DN476_c0_g13_i1.p1  ORF type:complete len:146 (+),score=37.03 TRINITY_DN476_c0_g13_i1:68-505(+)
MFSFLVFYFLEPAVDFLYPAYASFLAIESPESGDDSQWLTYWIVYGFMQVIEALFEFILEWIPFYYEIKFLFFVWLQAPRYMGAQYLYEKFIEPFLVKHEKQIDQQIDAAAAAASNKITSAAAGAIEQAKGAVTEAVVGNILNRK